MFVMDIPNDIAVPGPESLLEGTRTSFPMPPKGTLQRRLTHTKSGCRGDVQFNRLYLTHVEEGTPDFGKSFPITKTDPIPPSNVVWSHKGNIIAFNLPLDKQWQIFTAVPSGK